MELWVDGGLVAVAVWRAESTIAAVGPMGGVLMLSGPARSVLLRLGRSTLDSTLAASGVTEPGLAEEARDVYDRLANRVPWPDQLANRFHLVFNVLPVAARESSLFPHGTVSR